VAGLLQGAVIAASARRVRGLARYVGASLANAWRTNVKDGRRMVDYWHGSPTGLPVGTLLTTLRERKGSEYTEAQYDVVTSQAHDPDRVYFTTDRDLARAWGARSKGALLRVHPVGPVEPDPDFPPTTFSASQAVVVAVTT
jgi:hypothetical protein